MEAVSTEQRQQVVQNVVQTLLASGQYSAGLQVEKTASAFENKVFSESKSAADYFSRIDKKLSKVKALSAAAPAAASPVPHAINPPSKSAPVSASASGDESSGKQGVESSASATPVVGVGEGTSRESQSDDIQVSSVCNAVIRNC